MCCIRAPRLGAEHPRRVAPAMAIRVLIADDHELFRHGLRLLVADVFPGALVREAGSYEEALEAITDEGAGELLLLDLSMPGLAGAQSLTALTKAFPDAKLVIISASESRSDILAALAAGAHGYVPKSLGADEIATALKAVLEGRIFAPPIMGRRDTIEPAPSLPERQSPKLTRRQEEVLQELLKGQSTKQIARALGLAEGTVKTQLAAIYRALGVRSRAEAIAKLT
jgi:DNA-binding NarL/FixJ family response regulator